MQVKLFRRGNEYVIAPAVQPQKNMQPLVIDAEQLRGDVNRLTGLRARLDAIRRTQSALARPPEAGRSIGPA